MERKIHMRGRDGTLRFHVLDYESGVVCLLFNDEPVNSVSHFPPFHVALHSPDKWDLIRENIIELPVGSFKNLTLCKLKKEIIEKLKQEKE